MPVVQYSHLVNDDHQPVTTYLEELGGPAANPLRLVLELAEGLHNFMSSGQVIMAITIVVSSGSIAEIELSGGVRHWKCSQKFSLQ